MCKRNGESVDHHLIHCPIAFDLWSMDTSGAIGLLARKVWEASKCYYLDGYAPLFDVVHLAGEE